ncbi:MULTISPECIES: precorrin-6y C5,15-methyltransferase (decarboxylating) subunit CbiE [Streptomyces]|uniref:Precorrin-6y C5,15-methyltransferase (Decarboxylating) subunit CbiE n=2 Tax=Streptomyces olivaceus TaxID=47716 RepID=A0ABS7W5C0_STROV|nr:MULTISPECIES: precorrin-6y C5,15-methyltransferase (decarboxylating) subunit CbiE [Streptomyces]AOW86081.1 precorrin-6y C5,15-methyltransferase (decarboxylating) subunit CbiE [Streptomyces olivaceus]MBZ6082329.1 precorrin-6y C5,15-methyltransferase (decarboxylating) subunit CbiE [Streptomyces olivaceus]MBZ6090198.1 precorrin-6y C5,15-methyltransferase (decarboxylating) subunit CbiE [Streptomyces olivaceus]MBZ6096374.1 precorrin-6y C5,15-methyltransferase (decarboxylating) subunit CbiE [Strep
MADRVTVIGWDGSPLTAAARSALGAATLVAGAAHHLALPEVPPAAERIRLGSVALAARRIAAHRGTTVVLADGDPGFFGVVRTLRAPEYGLEVEVVPAVSSVAAAFARAGMPWDDAHVVVAHPRTLRRAVNVCRAHTKVAVLTSPGAGPAELGLLMEGVHRTFVICEELGTTRERVTVVTSDKAADHTWRDPNVVIVAGGSTGPGAAPDGAGWIAGRDPAAGPRGWSLPAEAYGGELGEGETDLLRTAQLARLGPRPGDLVWDIGCGGGAFAAEAARAGAAVIAVDRDRDACARTEAAARHFGVQVQTVHGTAPHVLENLPEPDVVRVGGGGAAVVSAVADRRPQRIVAHAATRDAAELVGRDLTEHGYRVECALLQSVGLDTRAWTETERSVAFLLSGVLPDRAP